MAYTKKTWVKGSTPLSAENFNHMEQGIADAHTEITQLNSDMERTKNIVFQSCGSGTSISVTMKNRNTINKTCDKMPLFVIGNGNGIPMCAIILINISGANISVDQVTNLTGYNLNCSASGDSFNIYNLPNWGYFMVIAPPGVYLDQSSNVI
jgi:hypothetical protein